MTKYDVIVSDRAMRMLGSSVRFAAKINKESALKTRRKIVKAFHSLSEMPERYPFFEAKFIPENKYHKMFVAKWYLVLYQIKENKVEIDYVIDCRRDYEWLI